MHRSYQSVLPTHNKLLQKRWDQQYYNEHRQKVALAKPTVDTKAPKTHLHLHLKLRKLQIEEERLAVVERDNRILLEKMSAIMRTKGRVDNRNDYEYKSLNREKRQKELLRITRENQEILRRILARKPQYSVKQWDDDFADNLKYMDSISLYPDKWWENPDFMSPRGVGGQTQSKSPRLQRSKTTATTTGTAQDTGTRTSGSIVSSNSSSRAQSGGRATANKRPNKSASSAGTGAGR